MRAITCGLVVALVTPAAAQGVDEPLPSAAPGFSLIERFDRISRAGGDFTYYFLGGNSSDASIVRLDVHAHYVKADTGWGGYLQLPVVIVTGDSSEAGIGNVELGGIYLPKLSTSGVELVLHAGLTLPTADDGVDALAVLVAGRLRPTDLYATLPRSSTLRLGVSPLFRTGKVFARLDLGMDLNLYATADNEHAPAFHLNLGGGAIIGAGVAIMAELSMLTISGDNGDSFAVAAVSVRGDMPGVQPYAALLLPLEDDVSDFIDLGLMAGLEAKL